MCGKYVCVFNNFSCLHTARAEAMGDPIAAGLFSAAFYKGSNTLRDQIVREESDRREILSPR